MSAILKFDFQKRKHLRFSEVNYLNYTKKDPILHVTTTFSQKQGETRTSSGPISPPLKPSPKTMFHAESKCSTNKLKVLQNWTSSAKNVMSSAHDMSILWVNLQVISASVAICSGLERSSPWPPSSIFFLSFISSPFFKPHFLFQVFSRFEILLLI